MDKTSIGDRMKGYENISRTYLPRRIPAIIRLDGKAFHTFTRGFDKPFDKVLMNTMQKTMQKLCFEIQGCVFGYTQSDEITLVLTDYETIKTDAWFGYNVQKMASISASIATSAFNLSLLQEGIEILGEDKYLKLGFYTNKVGQALFDARCFSIPKEEVVNCLIWRQQDATRNSIQAVGQAYFSQKELNGKSCNEIQDMLFTEKNINWGDLPTECKRGAACYKVEREAELINPNVPDGKVVFRRKEWHIDKEIPIFSSDKNFIERWL